MSERILPWPWPGRTPDEVFVSWFGEPQELSPAILYRVRDDLERAWELAEGNQRAAEEERQLRAEARRAAFEDATSAMPHILQKLIGQSLEGDGLAELLRWYLELFEHQPNEPDPAAMAAIGQLVYEHQARMSNRVQEAEATYRTQSNNLPEQ